MVRYGRDTVPHTGGRAAPYRVPAERHLPEFQCRSAGRSVVSCSIVYGQVRSLAAWPRRSGADTRHEDVSACATGAQFED